MGGTPQQYFVYVLRSEKNERRYVGSTKDVDERLRRHNAGHNKATKSGVPWTLVYAEQFSTRSEAARREIALKSGKVASGLTTCRLRQTR